MKRILAVSLVVSVLFLMNTVFASCEQGSASRTFLDNQGGCNNIDRDVYTSLYDYCCDVSAFTKDDILHDLSKRLGAASEGGSTLTSNEKSYLLTVLSNCLGDSNCRTSIESGYEPFRVNSVSNCQINSGAHIFSCGIEYTGTWSGDMVVVIADTSDNYGVAIKTSPSTQNKGEITLSTKLGGTYELVEGGQGLESGSCQFIFTWGGNFKATQSCTIS